MSVPTGFAWLLWGVHAALQGSYLLLWGLAGFDPLPGDLHDDLGGDVLRVAHLLTFATAATIGTLIAARHPANPIGWLLSVASTLTLFEMFVGQYAAFAAFRPDLSLPSAAVVTWAGTWLNVSGALIVPMLLLFPDGRLPSARWRPLLWITALLGLAQALSLAVHPGPLVPGHDLSNPFGLPHLAGKPAALRTIAAAGLPLASLLAASALVLRFRGARGEQRQQIKWIAFAALVWTLLVAPTFALPREWFPVLRIVQVVPLAGFVLAMGLALLKYRLYDIDLVINRTLVFGALAACVTAAYVLIVVGVGALAGTQGESSLVLSLLATALVAVAFQPLRERLQLLANRLVYGHRASPYDVLADFSRRMADALSVDVVLPRMAEAAALGVGATRTRVRVYVPGGHDRAVAWPDDALSASFDVAVPVLYQGNLVGEIAVATRPGEPLRPAEQALLANLAAQAGLALENVRLALEMEARARQLANQTDELRASRQRIVVAQDAERQRLERDIHDGAQQHLVALAVHLRLLKGQILKDPARARDAVDDLVGQANEALTELRDLSRGIYPPLLADRGLAAALQAQLVKSAPLARLEAHDDLTERRFDPRIEATVYFCVREALQNASKHAPGAPIRVWLATQDGEVRFGVEDQGPGFEAARISAGSGLQGMADRLAAAGGALEIWSAPGQGTRVLGHLPAEISNATPLDAKSAHASASGGRVVT